MKRGPAFEIASAYEQEKATTVRYVAEDQEDGKWIILDSKTGEYIKDSEGNDRLFDDEVLADTFIMGLNTTKEKSSKTLKYSGMDITLPDETYKQLCTLAREEFGAPSFEDLGPNNQKIVLELYVKMNPEGDPFIKEMIQASKETAEAKLKVSSDLDTLWQTLQGAMPEGVTKEELTTYYDEMSKTFTLPEEWKDILSTSGVEFTIEGNTEEEPVVEAASLSISIESHPLEEIHAWETKLEDLDIAFPIDIDIQNQVVKWNVGDKDREYVEDFLDGLKAEYEYASKEKGTEDRYTNPDGTFKEMTCPDNPDNKNAFCGCVRKMMDEGKSLESANNICGDIVRKKG